MHIAAPPDLVFPYLVDAARYVEWMGTSATLEPVPGGTYRVRMRDGFEAAGTFWEVDSPRRVVFSWGWAAGAEEHVLHERSEDGASLPAGSTRVVVTLADEEGSTQLTLHHHDLPTVELREAHRVAWQTYLPRLAVRAAGGDPGPDPHN